MRLGALRDGPDRRGGVPVGHSRCEGHAHGIGAWDPGSSTCPESFGCH